MWGRGSAGADAVKERVREAVQECNTVEQCCTALHSHGLGPLVFNVAGRHVLALPPAAYEPLRDILGEAEVPHFVERPADLAARTFDTPAWAPRLVADRILSVCTLYGAGGLAFEQERATLRPKARALFQLIFSLPINWPEKVTITALLTRFLGAHKSGHVTEAAALAPACEALAALEAAAGGSFTGTLAAVVLCNAGGKEVVILQELTAMAEAATAAGGPDKAALQGELARILKPKPLAAICTVMGRAEQPSVRLAFAVHTLTGAAARARKGEAAAAAADAALKARVAELAPLPLQPAAPPPLLLLPSPPAGGGKKRKVAMEEAAEEEEEESAGGDEETAEEEMEEAADGDEADEGEDEEEEYKEAATKAAKAAKAKATRAAKPAEMVSVRKDEFDRIVTERADALQRAEAAETRVADLDAEILELEKQLGTVQMQAKEAVERADKAEKVETARLLADQAAAAQVEDKTAFEGLAQAAEDQFRYPESPESGVWAHV